MCAADLATLGLTQSPGVYQRDYVKSTEVGGKLPPVQRPGPAERGRVPHRVDNVQFVESLPTCAFSYIANAAQAASDGAELQFTGRTHGFTFNGNIAYDNARYTETAFGPKVATGIPSILAFKGDNLGIPDWTANAGLQYDTRVAEVPVYARVDYAYTGKYQRQTSCSGFALYGKCSVAYGAQTNSLVPNYINGAETHLMNARVGLYLKDLEIAGYVKNLFQLARVDQQVARRRQLRLRRQQDDASADRGADELPVLKPAELGLDFGGRVARSAPFPCPRPR